MSIKVALMAEQSASKDDVVGAAVYFSLTFFIAFAMFEQSKTRDDAAGVIDLGSIVRHEEQTEWMQLC
jgi:hypothetical protein